MERTANIRATRALSKLLFGGAQYRIEIAAAIADYGRVANTTEIATHVHLARQTVNYELGKLESAGLLQRAEREGQRKVYLVGVDSAFWGLCQELRGRAEALLDAVPPY